eukprot:TRINITY_DN2156_c0_g3_i6.p1 TRINITY_DN2156_c0_g3~~TRINITY_DN2156_c0_g3_i6.p1  ORF type:complete len:257 (+),score=-29.46 TRINITY_DN2156_c0_g3_i6:55-771(+)
MSETKVEDDQVLELDLAFDPSMKKKKKKKRKSSKAEPAPAADGAAEEEAEEVDLGFGSKKKKKKKKKKVVAEVVESKPLGSDGDGDYDYFALLDRIQERLKQEGQTLHTGKKLRLPPPALERDGTTKTLWTNFSIICKKLGRSLEHVLTYTLAELGTSGSLDGSQSLSIKGRFQPKQVEAVLRHYISEFVKCNTCGSTSTTLLKENRMHFVACTACRSRRTVQSIRTGYRHNTRRRRR